MQHILSVTTPFFALVLIGWLVVKRGLVALEAVRGLNAFVLSFALPAMLFRFGATTPIARMLDPSVVLTWLACAAAMVAFTVTTTRRGGIGWNDASFGALVSAFPNSGFIGVPLLVALLGQQAAAPAIVALSLDMVFTSSACIALASRGARGEGVQAVRQALKGMAMNPLPWSIGLGCAVSGSGATLPTPLSELVSMLADAASPVALFALGGMLARPVERSDAAPRFDVARMVGYKLVVHPLLVLGMGRAMIALGAPLDAFAAKVLVLAAALPSASNVPMLAERFGADGGRLARTVLYTTIGSFGTFTAAVALLTR